MANEDQGGSGSDDQQSPPQSFGDALKSAAAYAPAPMKLAGQQFANMVGDHPASGDEIQQDPLGNAIIDSAVLGAAPALSAAREGLAALGERGSLELGAEVPKNPFNPQNTSHSQNLYDKLGQHGIERATKEYSNVDRSGINADYLKHAIGRGDQGALELPTVQNALKDLGHDGVIKTAYNRKQIIPLAAQPGPASPIRQYADGGEVAGNTPPDANSVYNDTLGKIDVNAAYNTIGSGGAAMQMPAEAATQPQDDGQTVNVVGPDGKLVSVPHYQVPLAMQQGYRLGTDDDVAQEQKQQTYGTPSQQAIAGLEGAASGATFGLSTAAERALGVDPADIASRREANPITYGAGQAAGLVGSMFTGLGEGALLGKAGAAAADLAGLGTATTMTAKIGSAALKGFVENGLFQAGDEVSKMFSNQSDPNRPVQTAIQDIGLSGLIGGAIGGGLGSVSPLWDATFGGKTGGILKAVVNKVGGQEGMPIQTSIEDAIQQSGLTMPPEVRSMVATDPQLQQWGRTLAQTDNTGAGKAFQEALRTTKNQGADIAAEAMGKSTKDLASMPEISTYERGKELGNTLADEYNQQLSPLSKEFDSIKQKYSSQPISPSISSKLPDLQNDLAATQANLNRINDSIQAASRAGDNETVISQSLKAADYRRAISAIKTNMQTPGLVDVASEKIAQLAQEQGWTTSPSSDIMREVNRVQKELPNLNKIGDVSNYITQVGANMQSDPLNGAMMRAGGLIKSILKDAEASALGRAVGEKEGAEAANRYALVRKAYGQQSAVKDALDERLHIGGSTSGYVKGLKNMAQTDGESLLRRLSGKGDADLLQLLQHNFPETAQRLREYHVDSALQDAVNKARPGETLNSKRLFSNLDKMSPELRNFAIPAEGQTKLQAVRTVLEGLDDPNYNFSNTARVMDKLLGSVPGSAMGLATGFIAHSPTAGLLVGGLTKVLGKDAPDAAKLALLKFMGSEKPVNVPGFKSMFDYAASVAKGEANTARAVKNIFKAGKEVLPASAMVSDQDKAKLNKRLEQIQQNPQIMQTVGGNLDHYLPDHKGAAAQTAGNAVQYLSSLKPSVMARSPLDSPNRPSAVENAKYDRALTIAQQPLIVADKIKKGTLTADDVQAINTMYPAYANNLRSKIAQEMTNHLTHSPTIPYKTRLSMALFMGQPMDSTMTPSSIQAAQFNQQPTQAANQQQAQQNNGKPPAASSLKGLAKGVEAYKTPAQNADSRRSTKD